MLGTNTLGEIGLGEVKAAAGGAAVEINVPVTSVTLAGVAPTVASGVNVGVPVAAVSLTAYAPSIASGVTVAVPAPNVVVLSFAPSIGDEIGAQQRGGFMPRRPRRVIPIEELFAVRDIFRGEEEPDRPAPPTRKRIKAVEHRVVNAVIDPYQPSAVRTEVRAFVHREVKAAVHPGLSWQDLSIIFERIMHEAAEKAAEVEREIEEEDEMILLLAA